VPLLAPPVAPVPVPVLDEPLVVPVVERAEPDGAPPPPAPDVPELVPPGLLDELLSDCPRVPFLLQPVTVKPSPSTAQSAAVVRCLVFMI
jgi:hypothetical protein